MIGEFHGLSSTAKRAEILTELGADRPSLAEFYLDGERVNAAGVRHLLRAMRRHSRPVKAAALGIIGREHFRQVIIDEGGDADTFRYHKIEAEGVDGLPFVVEAAFGSSRQHYRNRRMLTGINWSASIGGDPLRFPDYSSIDRVLSSQRVEYGCPVVVAVHVATPLPSFADRGKAAIWLTRTQAGAVTKAVVRVTEEWNKARLAEEKARDAATRERTKIVKAIEQEKRRRKRDQVVGSGILHSVIAEAAAACGTSISDMTVLSPKNDPFRRDTRDGHVEGQWVAEHLRSRRVHQRGFHYLLVVAGNVVKPDGSIYRNTDEDSDWLQNAVRTARWLKYVPFDQFNDERNEEPFVYVPAGNVPGEGYLTLPAGIELPLVFDGAPRVIASRATTAQPYRLVMFGEKSSLRDVLLPIAQDVGTELLLPTGETSDVMIYNMAARAAEDGRPTKVVYFSDFDPSGWQMPVSVSVKLLALRYLYFPNLDIELHRAALTVEQVRRLGLPSTPLKHTERRGDKWRARWGHEQTEIDALATVRPAELDRIARAALAPFYDPTLAQRNAAWAARWCRAAEQRLEAHPATAIANERMLVAYDALKLAAKQFDDTRGEVFRDLAEQVDIRQRVFRRRRVRIEAAAPDPLFSTHDDYATAAYKLIKSKALAGDGGDQ